MYFGVLVLVVNRACSSSRLYLLSRNPIHDSTVKGALTGYAPSALGRERTAFVMPDARGMESEGLRGRERRRRRSREEQRNPRKYPFQSFARGRAL
jgi:hypothetical protein